MYEKNINFKQLLIFLFFLSMSVIKTNDKKKEPSLSKIMLGTTAGAWFGFTSNFMVGDIVKSFTQSQDIQYISRLLASGAGPIIARLIIGGSNSVASGISATSGGAVTTFIALFIYYLQRPNQKLGSSDLVMPMGTAFVLGSPIFAGAAELLMRKYKK